MRQRLTTENVNGTPDVESAGQPLSTNDNQQEYQGDSSQSRNESVRRPTVLLYSFEGHGVRSVEIDGDIWFVAADVCSALRLSAHKGSFSAHLDKLDPDEKRRFNRDAVIGATPGKNTGVSKDGVDRIKVTVVEVGDALVLDRDPFCWLISESGLYVLVLRSRQATKPGTLSYRFRRWVTGEVLPAIRRSGHYGADGQAQEPAPGAFSQPGRYVTMVREGVAPRTFHSPYAQIVSEMTEADVRALAHSVKLIEVFWHKVEGIGAAGVDTSAGFARARLVEAIRSASELANHCLPGCEDHRRRAPGAG